MRSKQHTLSFWRVRRRAWLERSSHTSNHLPYLNIITTSLFFELNTYKSGIKNWQARVKLTHVFYSWLARSKFSLSSLHSVLGPINTWANVYKAKAIKKGLYRLAKYVHSNRASSYWGSFPNILHWSKNNGFVMTKTLLEWATLLNWGSNELITPGDTVP